mgnify:CR=1 FL=1
MVESRVVDREADEQDSQKEKMNLRRQDFARLKSVGFQHGAIVVAIMTLWASANAWAQQTDMILAEGVSIAGGFFAGVALAFLFPLLFQLPQVLLVLQGSKRFYRQ